MSLVRGIEMSVAQAFRDFLNARDAEMRQARESANLWRQEREYELLPSRPHFGDHLTPAVLLSMNTGLRRGELLALRWESIDFSRRFLTVEGGTSKNRQTRHVPLNDEAIGLLNRWRQQTNGGVASLKSERDLEPPGRSFSGAPTSRTFAGTTCVTTLPRA
jgi:integrase